MFDNLPMKLAKNPLIKLISLAIFTRITWLVMAYILGAISKNPGPKYLPLSPHYFSVAIQSFNRGDVGWYLNIAQNGYANRPFSLEQQENWAFYPLWPLVLKVGIFMGIDPIIFGWLLSNLFFLISLAYLYKLIKIDFHQNIAYLTTQLLIVYPASYFCSRPGPEALFCLLTFASFFYAKKEQWLRASVFSSLAVLTRLQGIILILPLAYIYYQKYKISRVHNTKALFLLLMPLSLICFMFYLYLLTGNMLANIAIQQTWDSRMSLPFISIIRYLRQPTILSYHGWDLSIGSFIFITISLVLTAILVKNPSIPKEYLIYNLVSLYLIISRNNIQASSRFIIPIFPLFLILSILIYNKRTLREIVLFFCISVQTFYLLAYIQRYSWAAT